MVRSASARVTIDENAHAHVAIDATLRIEGGWLEALELDGLDAGLVLDPLDPATMSTAPTPDEALEGRVAERLEPRVTLREDGVLELTFTRRHAPHRGDYVVHLAYDADLASRTHADADGVHVDWTFPAWRHGLDSVRVEITAPAGAHPVLGADDEIEVTEASDGDHAIWTLTRAHLARTREWPITLLLPEGAMHVVMPAPELTTRAALTSDPEVPRAPWQGGIALAAASVLVALRISRARRRGEVTRTLERPLLPLSAPVRSLGALVVGAALMGVALVGQDARWLAGLTIVLAVLASSRGPALAVMPRMGSFRHATPTIRQRARKERLWSALGIDAWLDASSPLGLVIVTAFGVFAWSVPRAALGAALLAFAVVLVASLDGARRNRPEPPLVALSRLLSFARRTRVSLGGPSIALMPVVHLDVGGVAQEARLRVLGAFPDGTLRADVVVARTGLLGAHYALLVVVARGTNVDAMLGSDARFETLAVGNERIARLTSIDRSGIDGAIARLAFADVVEATSSADRAAA